MRLQRPLRSQRGSVLVAVVFTAVILSAAAILVLDWSLNTLRDAKRKQFRDRVTLQANNEMEFLFYQWSDKVDEPSVSPLPTWLANTNVAGHPVTVTAEADLLGATQAPFLQDAPVGLGVRRGLTDLGLSALGTYTDAANNLRKKAAVAYYRARVRATMTDPILGTVEARVGRRFAFLRATPFTRAVFYEANMEFGAGSALTIDGDLQANGSIYIGAQSGYSTVVAGDIFFKDKYNGATDAMSGTRHTYVGPSTNDLASDGWSDPVYDPVPTDADVPNQEAQRQAQVKKLQQKEVFVSNNSTPEAIYDTYASANPPPYESVNDVYRSIIAPPPTVNGVEIAEDPSVKANRMYTKAGIRIAVEDDGSITVQDRDGTPITGLSSAISSVRSDITDGRENATVYVTTLDVGVLETVLKSNTTLQDKYNGVVYFYDKKALTSTSAEEKYAVRLSNAANVPNLNDHGFVLVSDNPVYIQGNFNTTQDTGETELPRCAVMGDAVTLLSQGWVDANSRNSLDKADESDTTSRYVTSDISINSAIVTGNSPTINSTYKSGGVQNLVRYLENWLDGSRSSSINGSLGQMFYSKYFNTPMSRSYQQLKDSDGNILAQGIYKQPKYRYINFDRRLAERPPAGTPSSRLSFYRGDLFSW